MKKLIITAVIALATVMGTVLPGRAELTRIADNVYAYVGVKDASPANSFAANAGIVIGRDGILVVDTLISAKEGERFLADIRRVSDKPITYVVNTHTHLDHAFGNCVFARLGAAIISQEADRALLEKAGATTLKNIGTYGLKPADMAGTEIAYPTLTFSERMTIDLGNEKVELIRTAPSHTAGSLVVYLPAKELLFSGDILFTDFHPYLADGDIPGWTRTIDALLAMDVERIVPGHGPLSTKKDLREMKEYLLLFDARARELAAGSVDAGAVAAELKKVLPARSQAEWMIPYNLKARYLKLQ
ncbi:MBL fold metallo-hydrolase [Geobacter sulfurreducens]|uniref:MBL fold metallo-hydrolase n=1 Tax=Geobacter sulfurreducens TaxID=35554 RepID=UPI000DBAE8D0|nr:MBL fold metallo-hydrolase [Geobacter sulfurreducens]BBA71184.1 Beta-lactamase [Geobacter sulfurreducens]